MRNELEHIERIEKYLRGELSAQEKASFEEQLRTDVNLQKEVELQKDVVKGIERLGVRNSIQIATRRYDNRRRGFFLGLFIVVLISFGIGVNYLSNSKDSIETSKEEVVVIPIENSEKNVEKIQQTVEPIEEQEANSEVVSLPEKKFQYFTINSSKDETITGVEGTIISFKANSFQTPSNTIIKIKLKEYYDMSDIVYSNLTTETVDGKLLETGGMIYIDAFLGDKKIGLKNKSTFDIKFPFEKRKKDMILFDGQIDQNKILWKESKTFQEEKWGTAADSVIVMPEIFTIVEKMPEFQGGQQKLFDYLGKNIKYPAAAKEKNISGKVFVNFIVDETGKIADVRVIRGVNPILDMEAVRVVSSMPKWNPGMQRGRNVSVSFNLPINFVLDGSTPTYNSEEMKYYSDSLKKAQKNDAELNLFDEDNNTQRKDASEQLKAYSDINYYILSGSRLGWINCDRFVRSGNLTVKIELDNNQYTDVKMIFHSVKGIMAGINNGRYISFNRIPYGEKVTIFAIKYMNKRPYICLKEVNTSNNIVKLDFEEMTKERLNEITKQISRI